MPNARETSKTAAKDLIDRTHSERFAVKHEDTQTIITLRVPEIKIGLLGASRSGKTHFIGSLYTLRERSMGQLFVETTATRGTDRLREIYEKLVARQPVSTTRTALEFGLSIRRGIRRDSIATIRFFDVAGQHFETAGSGAGARSKTRTGHRKKIADSDIIYLFVHIPPRGSLRPIIQNMNNLLSVLAEAWGNAPDRSRTLVVLFTQADIYAKDIPSLRTYMQSGNVREAINEICNGLRDSQQIRFNCFPVSTFGLGNAELVKPRNAGKGIYLLHRQQEDIHPFGTHYAFLWGISQYVVEQATKFSPDYVNVLADLDENLASIEANARAAVLY